MTKARVAELIDGWRSRLLAEGEIGIQSLTSQLAHAEWCQTLGDTVEALRLLKSLLSNEYICTKCGLRKDGENNEPAF